MKHIGIVAHSAEGAALCYRTICHEGIRLLGAHDHPDVTLSSIALARSMAHWDRLELEPIADILLQSVRRVAAAGADFFICPDNTAHIAFDHLLPRAPIPALHIAEVVTDQAVADGWRTIGVLGTTHTMEGPVYRRAAAARGLAYVVPNVNDRERINEIIFEELVNGVFTPESLAVFIDIIERLAQVGCDAVVLGCTEIPLIVSPEASPLPTLDSTRLLARAAVRAAL